MDENEKPSELESITGAALAWRPESVEDLDWCLQRMAELQRAIAQNDAILASAIERAKAKTTELNARLLKSVEFFHVHALRFADEHRTELLGGGKAKSRTLLHGRVGWRTRGGGLEVVDEAALLAWAKEQPSEAGLVRTTEAPALAEIKKYATEHQVEPPGTRRIPKFEDLEVRPSADALLEE